MAVTLTSNASTVAAVLIGDVGVLIPLGGGNDSFDQPEELAVLSRSDDIVTLCTDDAFGAGSHTLTLSDQSGNIAPGDVADYLAALNNTSPLTSAHGHVVAATIASSGPGAGYAPTARTYADGTTQAFTYLADGFSVDTLTETRPGHAAVVYTAVYNGNGIRTHWTKS